MHLMQYCSNTLGESFSDIKECFVALNTTLFYCFCSTSNQWSPIFVISETLWDVYNFNNIINVIFLIFLFLCTENLLNSVTKAEIFWDNSPLKYHPLLCLTRQQHVSNSSTSGNSCKNKYR